MSPKLTLQVGAILIADAHYSDKYPQFYSFLQAVDCGSIKTQQLILMGDMFELLFGLVGRTKKDNEKEVALLNKIAKKIEVVYFEGNHDFGLQSIFPNIKVFPLQSQPQIASFKNQKVMLSHGDTKTPLGYQVYTKIIRNPLVLWLIARLDILCGHCIIAKLKSKGVKKDPCYKIPLFEKIIHRRLSYLEDKDLDIVIEGHFHQNTAFNLHGFEYINLASFACNRKYFIVQSKQEQLHLQEIIFT